MQQHGTTMKNIYNRYAGAVWETYIMQQPQPIIYLRKAENFHTHILCLHETREAVYLTNVTLGCVRVTIVPWKSDNVLHIMSAGLQPQVLICTAHGLYYIVMCCLSGCTILLCVACQAVPYFARYVINDIIFLEKKKLLIINPQATNVIYIWSTHS